MNDDLLGIACSKIRELTVPAYVKDSEQRYVVVNDPYAAFFGMEADGFVGLTAQELFGHSEDDSLDDRERRALVFGEEQQASCFDPFGPDCYRVNLERFETEDGAIFVFGIFDAVPLERRAPADEALEEDLFRSMVEQSPSALFLRDQHHRLLMANSAYLALIGRAEAEVMGRTEIETLGEAGGRAHYEANQRLLESGETSETEGEMIHADGTPIPVLIRRSRIQGLDGHYYISGSLTDLTEIRQREAGLKAARAEAEGLHDHVESVLRALPVGVVIFGADLAIEYANDAFRTFWGIPQDAALIGSTLREFIEFSRPRRGAEVLASQTMDELYADRLARLTGDNHSASWQLTNADGRNLAVSSCRLDSGKYLVTYADVTAMRQREAESSLFRSALEQMQIGIFMRDVEGRMIFANEEYARIIGRPRESFIGLTETEMFPDRGERFVAENRRVMVDGETIEKNAEIMDGGEHPVPIMTRLSRIETVDGSAFLVGSISDISTLKEREKALISAQAEAERLSSYLDRILRNMPVGVMILDRSLDIEFVNGKVAEICGLAPDEVREGLNFRDYEARKRGHGWTWWSELDFTSDFVQRLEELRFDESHDDQALRDFDRKMVVVTSQRLIGDKFLLSYSDITDVRQREIEISEARAQLAQLGAFMQDATRVMSQGLMVIEGGEVKLINDALLRILDLPPALAETGRPWEPFFEFLAMRGDFGAPDEAQAALDRWTANLRQMTGFSTVFLAAGRIWVQLEVTPSGHGHWMMVCTDITESKQREAELTSLLARSEAADRAKSEFLANMSHEIRTPMNGVLGMAELLSKSLLDTRQKTFVDIIVKSGNALLTIINDILDFSKIDAGQLSLRKAPFDPVEAIEDVATLLSASAAEKDVELVVRGDATVRHMLIGDAGRFRQIATNLLGNAIKFTEKGYVLIELSSQTMESGDIMLEMRIEDTGIGIPLAKRETIFEKFSQVDTSSTRRHEGSGLGLAITAGLVQLFGGYIEVESEVGRGSVFTVHLPFAIASDRHRINPVPMMVQDARILVVDDNAVNRQILIEQLSNWGFDGAAVEDGEALLQILNEADRLGIEVDALIIDYQMPGMNGIDLARRIRSDRRFDHIAIVFLTSMEMAGDGSIFRELNIQAHLMKPARAYLLRSALVDVVRASRRNRDETSLTPIPPGFAVLPDLENAAAHADALADSGHDIAPGTLTVLVAEDNEVNQIVFTQILQAIGYRFLIVPNGQEAVDAFERYAPQVIVMDVSMPVMNGHQATRLIRVREKAAGDGRHVPIIGVTAHALDTDRDACFAVGMDDYLSKPISPELLRQKLSQWLDAAREGRVGAAE